MSICESTTCFNATIFSHSYLNKIPTNAKMDKWGSNKSDIIDLHFPVFAYYAYEDMLISTNNLIPHCPGVQKLLTSCDHMAILTSYPSHIYFDLHLSYFVMFNNYLYYILP